MQTEAENLESGCDSHQAVQSIQNVHSYFVRSVL